MRMLGRDLTDEADRAAFRLLRTPAGEPWSGRTRYAAAMHFYERGLMPAEALEAYRICARLDHEDPARLLADRGIVADWLKCEF